MPFIPGAGKLAVEIAENLIIDACKAEEEGRSGFFTKSLAKSKARAVVLVGFVANPAETTIEMVRFIRRVNNEY